ncbi:MAG: hypothetical protein H7X92_01265 [Chitinophagales bacterium]|nr:hypothetical protein [Hyphomicrobiales bacterium]
MSRRCRICNVYELAVWDLVMGYSSHGISAARAWRVDKLAYAFPWLAM